MGALQLSSFPSETFPAAQMSILPTALPSLGACCMIYMAELYKRRGAPVSVNVRTQDMSEDELGPVISLDHAPKRAPKMLRQETDQALVAELLTKVKVTAPDAVMKWNEDERCWYIKAKRPVMTPALRLHRQLVSTSWINN